MDAHRRWMNAVVVVTHWDCTAGTGRLMSVHPSITKWSPSVSQSNLTCQPWMRRLSKKLIRVWLSVGPEENVQEEEEVDGCVLQRNWQSCGGVWESFFPFPFLPLLFSVSLFWRTIPSAGESVRYLLEEGERESALEREREREREDVLIGFFHSPCYYSSTTTTTASNLRPSLNPLAPVFFLSV
jgi:hypothetical protein